MREPVDYSAGHSRDIFCYPYIILINNGFGWLEAIKAGGCRGAVGSHFRTKHQRTYLQDRSRIIPGHHINGITTRPYKNRRYLDTMLEKFQLVGPMVKNQSILAAIHTIIQHIPRLTIPLLGADYPCDQIHRCTTHITAWL